MIDNKSKSLWIRETASGGIEYKTSSKVLISVLPFLVAALVYNLLIVLEGLEKGPAIITVLTYGIFVLVAVLMLLVIMISIIDYLRRFE